MALIKGITVTLIDRVQNGVDGFNRPVFTENEVNVDNVLIEPVSSNDIVGNTDLSSKNIQYRLCIPKSDTHEWEDRDVLFWNHRFHTVGFAQEYIDDMVPLEWNRKVMVERYG